MILKYRSSLTLALLAAGILAGDSAYAVRVNPDGHGQALIYPYYTARSTISGNAFVAALTVTNITGSPKAVKVRILEAKAGAEVFGFNLFLDAYDVWTGGVVPSGAQAGLFTQDYSCTSPAISRSSLNPARFSNAAYVGDLIDDSLDRTYEGYIEVLEMGVIDPASDFSLAVTHVPDFTAPNASKPPCNNLPATDAVPAGLLKPAGGLIGNVSYLNVNEGTDYSVDATALSQWSNRVQWSGPGNAHPNLADASPALSFVVDSKDDGDTGYLTLWTSGRDAISALFMTDCVINDYTVESSIRGATDWVLPMPTKRFHVDRFHGELPFAPRTIAASTSSYVCQPVGAYGRCWDSIFPIFDREGQRTYAMPEFTCTPNVADLCGAAAGMVFYTDFNGGNSGRGSVLLMNAPYPEFAYAGNPPSPTGWLEMRLKTDPSPLRPELGGWLTAPHGATTIINGQTGAVTAGASVTYFGLPVLGFSVQSYSTTGLPGVSNSVLSNYGGQFNHKIKRRIEVSP